MPTLGEDFTNLITKLQENRLTPADTGEFAARLDRVEQTFTPLQKWVTPGGLRVPSIEATEGTFTILPHEYAVLQSASAPHATLTNDTETAITGMTAQVFGGQAGLTVDTSGSWIGLDAGYTNALYLVTGIVTFVAASTGDRLIKFEFYNAATDTWEQGFYPATIRATATNKPVVNGSLIIQPGAAYTRVRMLAKHTQGTDLDIEIPRLSVCRLR